MGKGKLILFSKRVKEEKIMNMPLVQESKSAKEYIAKIKEFEGQPAVKRILDKGDISRGNSGYLHKDIDYDEIAKKTCQGISEYLDEIIE